MCLVHFFWKVDTALASLPNDQAYSAWNWQTNATPLFLAAFHYKHWCQWWLLVAKFIFCGAVADPNRHWAPNQHFTNRCTARQAKNRFSAMTTAAAMLSQKRKVSTRRRWLMPLHTIRQAALRLLLLPGKPASGTLQSRTRTKRNRQQRYRHHLDHNPILPRQKTMDMLPRLLGRLLHLGFLLFLAVYRRQEWRVLQPRRRRLHCPPSMETRAEEHLHVERQSLPCRLPRQKVSETDAGCFELSRSCSKLHVAISRTALKMIYPCQSVIFLFHHSWVYW